MDATLPLRVVWSRPDGFVCQLVLSAEEAARLGMTPEQFAAWEAQRQVPAGTTYHIKHINDLPFPRDVIRFDHARRLFRHAWELDAQGNVAVSVAKARAEMIEDVKRTADGYLAATQAEYDSSETPPQTKQQLKAARDAVKAKHAQALVELPNLQTLADLEEYWPFSDAEEEKAWAHAHKNGRRNAPGQEILHHWSKAVAFNAEQKQQRRELRAQGKLK